MQSKIYHCLQQLKTKWLAISISLKQNTQQVDVDLNSLNCEKGLISLKQNTQQCRRGFEFS